ncbi:MAG TPA: primosomal protein [Pseudonocardiaceae bacterium]|jgi:hypothetical protein
MAQDIVPIELSLTAGDLVTLWAPRWREEGEEWEAFLGDDDELFAFAEVAELVGFARTACEHDLADHPAWPVVAQLPAPDLVPEDAHRYDLVGVPELVADPPDTWLIAELADVVAMLRSLADVCELDKVHEVLDAAPGFELLQSGVMAFSGREGERRWNELCTVIAERWDEVLDAVDHLVRTPAVDADAVARAESELTVTEDPYGTPAKPAAQSADDGGRADPALAFWSEVGIDPIRIISDIGDHYTLRCYLDDVPVFLGRAGRIDVCTSPRALVRYLAGNPEDHDLETVATWGQVRERARAGELSVAVDEDNTYVLAGLADDLNEGPTTVDPVQLDLAVELITDAEQWAGSDAAERALASSEPLGWLVSFVLRPDPMRLAPSPPFEAEMYAWRTLATALEERLRVH